MSEAEHTLNSGENTVKKGVSSGINLGIKIAKAGGNASKGAIIKGLLLGGLGPETLCVLVLSIIIIIIPLLLISVIPSGSLFQTQEDMNTAESKVARVIESSYGKEIQAAKSQIFSFMQENYPEANVIYADIKEDKSGFSIENNTCSVSVYFSPSVYSMATNITAYANAVNATIAFYSESAKSEDPDFKDQAIDISNSGEICMTDKARAYISENTTELTNANAEDFIRAVGLNSSSFFVYDNDESRWDLNDFHTAPKTHTEMKTRTVPVGTDPDTGEYIYKVESYEAEVTETAWYGEISIVMFYDLSGYKADEIDECIRYAGNLKAAESSISDPTTLVGNTIETFYSSYITYSNGHIENGKFIEGTDNREDIFSMLLDSGTLMYIPISGLSSKFTEGEPGYSGDAGFNEYDNKTSAQIWNDIKKLRSKGLVGSGTAMWNCTAFAEAWFYEIYGVDALYGNGCNMVENLLASDFGKENFYRGSSPAPGGIFSVGSAYGANHVGCIDAVDYENKTITFSDGNTNGAANSTSTIRIKKTMTFEEFRTHINASRMATTGSASGWITFANPREDFNK